MINWNFRNKILLALVLTIAVLTGLTLVVMTFFVRSEILRRTETELHQARSIFRSQQAQRFQKSEEICSRLVGSRRLAAAQRWLLAAGVAAVVIGYPQAADGAVIVGAGLTVGGLLAAKSFFWLFLGDGLTTLIFAFLIWAGVPETRPARPARPPGGCAPGRGAAA